ncbi:electron transport complex subunit RsxB [Nitrosospira multiformis]|uniref:Electron transport complex protein RnfB n=1 Tax=Nitrosospira multiformis TaxID=1231 RepID=A0A1I7HN19_9PROT|nr:electron transport complex subunit RsxB [Nitrosospira multiformis]SFU61836.1 electron transport complex protein RnfB [Nitrosospira multiformis]
MKEVSLAEEIDAILPQTQCRQCGFSGCRPYAEAIAEGRAQINQCPPGGEDGIHQLARLLRIESLPLSPAHGVFKPKEVALIDEQACIGCTLCIQACPVDAIVGAARQMHTVISGECTGCSLCLEPCPVDCIQMVLPKERSASTEIGVHVSWIEPDHQDYEVEKVERVEKKKAADRARARYQLRLQRLEHDKQGREERLAKRTEATATVVRLSSAPSLKKVTVQAALERARAARAQASPGISEKEGWSDRTSDISSR